MNEWRKIQIKELCSDIIDCVNKTAPISNTPTKYRMLRTSDIRDGFINLENLNCVTEKTYNKWTRRGFLQKGDIILTREAPLGEVGLVRYAENFFLGQRLVLLRANPSVCDNRFLLYALQFHDNKQAIIAKGVGATVLHLRVPECEKIEIRVPDLQTQRKIGNILFAYDNLIENNQKQIKLLEEAAQRLYKEWFVDLRFPGYETTPVVDGLPEGWELCHLEDVIEFNPKVPLSKERLKQSVPMSALSTSSMTLDTEEFAATFSNSGSKFQNGDTLLARITPCLENGKTAFVAGVESDEGAVGSTEFIVMRSKGINPYMVYLLARNDSFRQSAINSMTGSDGRQRAQADKLKALPYLKPTDQIMMLFARYVELMFIQIQKKNEQNVRLRQARDRLLPKLMSGEVEV